MMRTIALSAIAALATAYNTHNGLGVSVTQEGITSVTNVVVPIIFGLATDLKVPDYEADGLKLTNIVASASAPTDLSDISITLGAAHNSVALASTGVGAHITADFSYKVLFSTITGSMDITVTDAGLDLTTDLSTQQGDEFGELAPALTCESVKLDVDSDNVAITLSGGAVDKIASSLIALLKSSILPTVIDSVQDTIKTGIDTTANDVLSQQGTH
jgi:hypothetical protein